MRPKRRNVCLILCGVHPLFIYLGFYVAFNTGSCEGRGNQYMQLVTVLYCKLLTNSKQLPAFPLKVRPGTEPRSQRWEARVLPLCHHAPHLSFMTSEKPVVISFWKKTLKLSILIILKCLPGLPQKSRNATDKTLQYMEE